MDKHKKRQRFLILRSKINSSEMMKCEDRITELLKRDPDLINAKSVAGYAAIRKELSVSQYLQWALENGKRVYFPRCNGSIYEMVEVTDLKHDLTEGHYGILEPKQHLPAASSANGYSDIEAWIVPGVAFTPKGERLGMGKGIYDRLMEHSKAPKIGVGYECQKTDTLPIKPWDVLLSRVLFV